MGAIQIKRKYRFSDGTLITKGSVIIAAGRRDATEVAEYGYDSVAVDAIDAKITALLQMPTDIELTADLKEKTEAKNQVETDAIDHIMKQLMQRVEQKYGLGLGSAVYDRFGVSGIQNMRDGDFLVALFRIHRKADDADFKTDMASVGLTQAHVDAIGAFANDYKEKLLEQNGAVDQRDRAVENRVNAANELYEDLVKLADLGKRLWAKESEAKYNDYVIYPTTPPPVQLLDGNVPGNDSLVLSVTSFDADTVFTFRGTTGGALKAAFVAQATDPPPATAKIIPANGDPVAHAASDLGYAPGERELLLLWNENAEEAGYEVTYPG